jgi:predicted phage-related endonuclease
MKLIEKPPHGSLDWLLKRHRDAEGRVVFGASEASALMGASNYTSRPELFAAKLNEPQVGKETAAFRRGNLIEPVLIAEAGVVLGIPFHTPPFMYHKDRFIISLDGVDESFTPSVVIEAKTTTRYRIRDENDLPNEWLWQAWAQSAVTGAEVYFSVLDSEQTISVIQCPRNQQATDALLAEAASFAERIEQNTPPEDFNDCVIDAATVAQIWRAKPTSIELADADLLWLQEMVHAKELIAEGELLKKTAEGHLAMLLKENEVGTFNGVKVLSWKEQPGRASLDTKALREDHPEIVAKYEKQGKPFRVMRTHKVAPATA